MGKVIILMGSNADMEHSRKISATLDKLGIESVLRVGSAHKTPVKVLDIIRKYDEEENIVYITVAGRSNALSAFVDFQTTNPVIACPPYGDKFAGVDIYSTLRLPSGVAPVTVLEPEASAIAAAKMLALSDLKLRKKIQSYQKSKQDEVEQGDQEALKGH